MNRMQKTTVCLVFLDSCGCGPTPRIHLRAEHPGVRSMAIETPPVKRDLVVTASVECSQDTAHRDIVDLVKRGILAKDAAGGRSTSYSLTEPAGKTGPG